MFASLTDACGLRATIFSDTSILIQKLVYDKNRRTEIEGNIEGQKFITCQYVLMEFRRNILQGMNYLRSILREMTLQGKEEIQLDELLVHLSFARGLFHSTRAVQSLFLALSTVIPMVEGHTLSTLQFSYQVARQIQRLQLEATRSFSDIVDSVHCDLVRESAPLGDFIHSRLSCNAQTAQCKLIDFLAGYSRELIQIQQAMEAAEKKKVDTRTLAALRRVNTDVRKALGERVCWALGDVIITLEAPKDALIYTVDRHFEVICEAIGKRLFKEHSKTDVFTCISG